MASPTQTGPTFTWRWVSGYVGPRFCDVMLGLLQRHSRLSIQVHHRQAAASTECCRSRRQWLAEVRPRTHSSPARRAALVGRFWAGAQAVRNGPSMSAAQSTTVHDGLLQTLLVASICRQLFVPRHCRHRHSISGRRAFSVAGPAAWNSLPDYHEIWHVSLTVFAGIWKLFFSRFTRNETISRDCVHMTAYINIPAVYVLGPTLWNCLCLNVRNS